MRRLKQGLGGESGKSITETGKHQHMHTPPEMEQPEDRFGSISGSDGWGRGGRGGDESDGGRSDTCPIATPKHGEKT